MTAALIALAFGVLLGAGITLLTIHRRQLAANHALDAAAARRAACLFVPPSPASPSLLGGRR